MSSAADFCAEVQMKKSGWESAADIVSSVSPYALIGKFVDRIGSHSDSQTIIKNNIENVVSSSTRSILEQGCDQRAHVSQLNSADNSKCLALMKCGAGDSAARALAYKAAGFTTDEILKLSLMDNKICQDIVLGDFTQSNSSDTSSSCVVDQTLKVLTEAKLDSSLMALYQKLQESKGLMTGTTSLSKNCNNVSNKVSSESLAEAYQKCSSLLNLNQTNTAACVSKADQKNVAKLFDTCMLKAGVLNENSQQVAATLDTHTSESVKAAGITPLMVLIVVAGLVLCAFLYLKFLGSRAPPPQYR